MEQVIAKESVRQPYNHTIYYTLQDMQARASWLQV